MEDVDGCTDVHRCSPLSFGLCERLQRPRIYGLGNPDRGHSCTVEEALIDCEDGRRIIMDHYGREQREDSKVWNALRFRGQ